MMTSDHPSVAVIVPAYNAADHLGPVLDGILEQLPATDIWAARKKAVAEGKPILLWYMAGEPLGAC